MSKDFLKDLNPEQQKAVLHTKGPSIILAGAGSGKTRVLTYKVIYLIKKEGVDPTNILMVTFTNKAANEMRERIQKFIKENNALDFDDLILKIIYLFDKNPQILSKYQRQFEYILVDEYQDTNRAQYVLTKLLAGLPTDSAFVVTATKEADLAEAGGKDNPNICVVGDFSQSIYSWRGADFQNLSKFKEDFSRSASGGKNV